MRTRACNFEWFHGHLCLHNIMRVTEDIIYVRKPRVHRDTLHVHNILRFRIPLDPRAHNIMLRRAHPCPCASSALYYAYTTSYHVCVCVYTRTLYPCTLNIHTYCRGISQDTLIGTTKETSYYTDRRRQILPKV